MSASLKKHICSFVHPVCERHSFDIRDIQMQSKSSECGLIAKPCAIEIAERRNPVVCQRDGSQMRPYLKRCFTEGKLQRFLYTKKHSFI